MRTVRQAARVGSSSGRACARVVVVRRGMATQQDEVPVIDLGPSFESASGRQEVAQQIGSACRDIGFMTIVNHGIDEAVIERMWGSTKSFFDLPEAEKLRMKSMSEEYPYGYSGFMEEVLAAGKAKEDDSFGGAKPDLKESFSMGPYNPAAGMPPVQWPAQPADFERSWMEYYQSMEKLSGHMLELFALALDLPQDWFVDKVDKHRSALRAL